MTQTVEVENRSLFRSILRRYLGLPEEPEMRVNVEVAADHLLKISKLPQPIVGVEELIWNALDADATEVDVNLKSDSLTGIVGIKVSDNGHGLERGKAAKCFGSLGGSWKHGAKFTRVSGRTLHGKAGRGRFRAFGLGDAVTWKTRYANGDGVMAYTISGSISDLGTFEISDEQPAKKRATGTDVEIRKMPRTLPALRPEEAVPQLAQRFALYLRSYPQVKIRYGGIEVDPASAEANTDDYEFTVEIPDESRTIDVKLTVIEWRRTTDRALYLCDQDGFVLGQVPPGIQAPGRNFTAYLKSAYIRERDEDGNLSLEEMHSGIKKLLIAGKEKLREHFRRRDAEEAVNLVEGWKREKVYPFVGEPQNFIEQTERQIFDVVALSLNTYLPDFESADPKSKQLSLRLLKHTLEDSPTTVRKILQDVLDLPAEKQDEFAQLLERTSLSAIISASKAVADRLDFLKGLEMLVFDPENKKTLLERQQLQHILKDHTWIFGEEFHLSVDDQSLTEVLKKHLEKLGRPTVDPDPVVRPDGSEGIVDLMLSRLIPQTRQEHREHLIVELKRPSQPISNEIISQIRSYAFAVAEDERFRDVSTRWIFWAVSNTMTAGARKEARQANRPDGLLFESDGEIRIEVWAKSWGEIIDSCRARLQYFQQHLKYGVTDDSALEYLRKTHEKYLPESMTKPAEEVPPVDPVDQSGADIATEIPSQPDPPSATNGVKADGK